MACTWHPQLSTPKSESAPSLWLCPLSICPLILFCFCCSFSVLCPLPLTPDSVTAECLNLSRAAAWLELSRRRYQWQEIQAPLAFRGTALGYRLVSLPAPLPLCGRTVSCRSSFGGRQSLLLPLGSSEHLWAMAPFPAQALAKEPISWGISGHPLLMAPPHGGS